MRRSRRTSILDRNVALTVNPVRVSWTRGKLPGSRRPDAERAGGRRSTPLYDALGAAACRLATPFRRSALAQGENFIAPGEGKLLSSSTTRTSSASATVLSVVRVML